MNILKITLKACFFYFCFNCVKISCSLENPNLYDEIKGKQVFGEIL